MKTLFASIPRSARRRPAGFTLPEMMITMFVFGLIIAAMMGMQLFASRIYTLAATKLVATASGREALNAIRDQIRSAKVVYVGSYTNSQFTVIPNGSPQVGNAVQISPDATIDTTNYIVYFQDPAQTNISCVSNGVVNVLANFVTNTTCFWAEDFQGNTMTNYMNNPVIRMQMQFVQWEYPIGFVGGSNANAYDFYYLRTRITRRAKF